MRGESMREKQRKFLVTFHTTADAMAMEQACREQNVQGRLIPVPRQISAGCGLAWCADPQNREALKTVLQCAGIQEQEMRECLI